MQDAINDSAKDRIRIDESLNYIKQRLFETGDKNEAQKIERFQNPVDIPYREVHGAAALYSCENLDTALVCAADTRRRRRKAVLSSRTPTRKISASSLLMAVT
jgi:hypothetical protein